MTSAAADGLRTAVTQAWRRVLHRDAVEDRDHFFELGGTSLTAIELCSELNETLGLGVDARLLFSAPTLDRFLSAMTLLDRCAHSEVRRADRQTWPLLPSHAWFFSRRFAHPERFAIALLFRVVAPVRFDALHQAITCVVERHDALRTRFRPGGNGWEQVALDEPPCVDHHDLAALAAVEQPPRIESIGKGMADVIDLAAGPLVRFATIDLGPAGGARLMLVAHHLVADYGSWRIVAEDIDATYRGMLRAGGGRASPTSATTSVRDWALWLNSAETAAEALQDVAQWTATRPEVTLPFDSPDGVSRQGNLKRVTDEPLAAAIVRCARQLCVGPDVLLLAAYASTLGEWCATDRVAVDIISHARTPTPPGFNLSRTVGWLTLQAPLFIDGCRGPSPSEVVPRVVQAWEGHARAAIAYNTLRFSSALAGRFAAALPPDGVVGFNYVGNADARYGALSLLAPASESTGVRSDHPPLRPLELLCVMREGQLLSIWLYDARVLARSSIERLAEQFERCATALIADAHSTATGVTALPTA